MFQPGLGIPSILSGFSKAKASTCRGDNPPTRLTRLTISCNERSDPANPPSFILKVLSDLRKTSCLPKRPFLVRDFAREMESETRIMRFRGRVLKINFNISSET